MPIDWSLVLAAVIATSFSFLLSSISRLTASIKKRRQLKKVREDSDYVQRFFESVGNFLGEPSSNNFKRYREFAADIYRHIPSKHWEFAEKIDAAISADNYSLAWDYLKKFSQSLALDDIQPITQQFKDNYSVKLSADRSDISCQ